MWFQLWSLQTKAGTHGSVSETCIWFPVFLSSYEIWDQQEKGKQSSGVWRSTGTKWGRKNNVCLLDLDKCEWHKTSCAQFCWVNPKFAAWALPLAAGGYPKPQWLCDPSERDRPGKPGTPTASSVCPVWTQAEAAQDRLEAPVAQARLCLTVRGTKQMPLSKDFAHKVLFLLQKVALKMQGISVLGVRAMLAQVLGEDYLRSLRAAEQPFCWWAVPPSPATSCWELLVWGFVRTAVQEKRSPK